MAGARQLPMQGQWAAGQALICSLQVESGIQCACWAQVCAGVCCAARRSLLEMRRAVTAVQWAAGSPESSQAPASGLPYAHCVQC